MFTLLLSACTLGSEPAPQVRISFDEVQTSWSLTPAEDGHTEVALLAGNEQISFGTIDATCTPRPDLPFKEVNGQRTFAALACRSGSGNAVDFVLIDIPAEEPEWPHPIALAALLTHETEDDKVMMRSLGASEIPVGMVLLPPEVEDASAPPQDPPSDKQEPKAP